MSTEAGWTAWEFALKLPGDPLRPASQRTTFFSWVAAGHGLEISRGDKRRSTGMGVAWRFAVGRQGRHDKTMRRADVIAAISAHREEIVRRFGVRSLSLFGSVARRPPVCPMNGSSVGRRCPGARSSACATSSHTAIGRSTRRSCGTSHGTRCQGQPIRFPAPVSTPC